MKDLSECCQSSVKISTGDEGTSCYICSACGRPCDLYIKKPFRAMDFIKEAKKLKDWQAEDDKKRFPTGITTLKRDRDTDRFNEDYNTVESRLERLEKKIDQIIEYLNKGK